MLSTRLSGMTAYLHSARSPGGMSGTSSSVNQACAPRCKPQDNLLTSHRYEKRTYRLSWNGA